MLLLKHDITSSYNACLMMPCFRHYAPALLSIRRRHMRMMLHARARHAADARIINYADVTVFRYYALRRYVAYLRRCYADDAVLPPRLRVDATLSSPCQRLFYAICAARCRAVIMAHARCCCCFAGASLRDAICRCCLRRYVDDTARHAIPFCRARLIPE